MARNQLAYLPVDPATGFGAAGLWWDSAGSEWTPIPAFGEAAYQLLSPSIAQVGGQKMLTLPGTAAYFLAPGADAWQRRAAPPGILGIVGPVGDLLLIETEPSGDKPILGFMDVSRYASEAPP